MSGAEIDATLLAVAVRCYQALTQDWAQFEPVLSRFLMGPDWEEFLGSIDADGMGFEPPSGDFRDKLLVAELLQYLVNESPAGIMTVFPRLEFRSEIGWWVECSGFENLTSIMWFQLYKAILGRSIIRICEGCDVFLRRLETIKITMIPIAEQ